MLKNQEQQAPAGASQTIGSVVLNRAIDLQKDLFEAFLACRTTLEDLADRTSELGQNLRSSVIAAHLTGKISVSDAKHNALAEAINKRLGELSLPPAAPFKDTLRRHRPDPGSRPDDDVGD